MPDPRDGPHVVVATTVAPYKAKAGEACDWLATGAAMIADVATHGGGLSFFVAVEVPSSHREVPEYAEIYDRLSKLRTLGAMHVSTWRFALDDGEHTLTTGNRLNRICTGRNLCHEYAVRAWASHLLFLDSDISAPPDIVTKLLAVDHPLVGAEVPTYCLSGPAVPGYDFPVQEHWNTAGALLVRRDVFRRIRWRWDPDAGMTDDPCFAADVEAAGFGRTYVRKDVICHHHPETIVPLEHRGQDLALT